MTNKHSAFTLRRSFFDEGPLPTLRDQSLHFANRNSRNPQKIKASSLIQSLQLSGFQGLYLQTLSLKGTSVPCLLASLPLGFFAPLSPPCRKSNNETAIRNGRK